MAHRHLRGVVSSERQVSDPRHPRAISARQPAHTLLRVPAPAAGWRSALAGSGLVICNPPWQFEQKLETPPAKAIPRVRILGCTGAPRRASATLGGSNTSLPYGALLSMSKQVLSEVTRLPPLLLIALFPTTEVGHSRSIPRPPLFCAILFVML
jgi:hypothetical protein